MELLFILKIIPSKRCGDQFGHRPGRSGDKHRCIVSSGLVCLWNEESSVLNPRDLLLNIFLDLGSWIYSRTTDCYPMFAVSKLDLKTQFKIETGYSVATTPNTVIGRDDLRGVKDRWLGRGFRRKEGPGRGWRNGYMVVDIGDILVEYRLLSSCVVYGDTLMYIYILLEYPWVIRWKPNSK